VKRWLILLLAVLAVLGSASLRSVQECDYHHCGYNDSNPTFTSSTTSSNLIAVLIHTDGTMAATPITDSVGNTYAQCGSNRTSASSYTIAVFYAKSITGGASFTVTAHTTATADTDIMAAEFSGLDTTSPCDQTQSAEDATTATALTSGNTATTTVANEALFGGWGSNQTSGITFTAGTSWTARETVSNTTDGHSSGMQTRIVSSTNAYQSDVTLSNGGVIKVAYIATFKGATSVLARMSASRAKQESRERLELYEASALSIALADIVRLRAVSRHGLGELYRHSGYSDQ
jgi:hypothetical protein